MSTYGEASGSNVKFTKIPELDSNEIREDEGDVEAAEEEKLPLARRYSDSPASPHAKSSLPYEEIHGDSVRKPGVTKVFLLTVFSVALSSFQFGYTVGVVNAPEKIVRQWYNETYIERYGINQDTRTNTILWAITVASYGVSGLIGGLLSGYFCEKFGRRGCLLLNNIPNFIAAALVVMARPSRSYELVILSRLFSGFNCGISSGAVPIYLAEISPLNLRGATGATNQLAMTIATLLSQVLGLPFIFGAERTWPLLFALCAVPSFLQIFLLSFLPESPQYLFISIDHELKARQALKRLRGHQMESAIDAEIEEMKREQKEKAKMPILTYRDMVKNLVYRKGLIITSVSQIAQQLTGIGAIISFSTGIFLTAGLSPRDSLYATCGIGTINVLVTLVSMSLIERTGRRTLFLSGLAGMGTFNALLCLCLVIGSSHYNALNGHIRDWSSYGAIAMVVAFICSFGIGPGVIAWFVPAEPFTQVARSKGTSVSVGVNWIANFITILMFPIFHSFMGNYVFLIFAGVACVTWIYLYANLPETKDKTPDQITHELKESLPTKAIDQSTSLLSTNPNTNKNE